jgi:hypothetical protein
MTDEGITSQEDFERYVKGMMEELFTSHPEIVAKCKPGMLIRPVEGDRLETFMIAKDDGRPMVLGTFPRKWLNPPKG